MIDFNEILENFNYEIPESLIAQSPKKSRDQAKLLIYKKEFNKIFYDKFINLPEYLPKNSVLVFNRTKVLPARLLVKKLTGGIIKILYVSKRESCIQIMANKSLEIGSRLYINKKLYFDVQEKEGKYYFLKPNFSLNKLYEVLEKYGVMPIPPYIKHSKLSEKELRKQYQSIFADQRGSIAAPTASLHFSNKLLRKIKKSGIKICFVILHVGLGTFAPLTEEQYRLNKLHKEEYEIPLETAKILNDAKNKNKPIIAVGTTVVRTLEYAANQGSVLGRLKGETDLFIKENYKFKFVNGIITNFHVPKSSLMMLVSAFICRDKLLNIYKKAIEKRFRFFSFGDGMLII